MAGPKPETDDDATTAAPAPPRLKDAMHRARVEAAERTSVVVDLRDAEVARLELLNEALDPLFADIPPHIDLFDRAISRGDTPRLWVDIVAHVVMGPDKRVYRFVQDTRHGRRVHAESHEINEIVAAVTDYVARRLVERERALEEDPATFRQASPKEARRVRWRRLWRTLRPAAFALILGLAAIAAALWLFAARV
jgi:hypothetical protein